MSKEDLTTHFMTMLKEALSEKKEELARMRSCLRPRRCSSSWLKDPYALCGYSAQLVGSELTDFDAFSTTPYGAVYLRGSIASRRCTVAGGSVLRVQSRRRDQEVFRGVEEL